MANPEKTGETTHLGYKKEIDFLYELGIEAYELEYLYLLKKGKGTNLDLKLSS